MKLSVFYPHIREAAQQTELPEEEIMRRVRASGVTAVDLDLSDWQKGGDALIKRLTDAGLSVSYFYAFHDWTHGDYASGRTEVDAARKCGAAGILVVPGFLSEEEAKEMNALTQNEAALFSWMDKNDSIRHITEGLRETVRYAGDLPVTLEDFDGNTAPFATALGLKYFMDHVEGLRFVLDTGNFAYSDEDVLNGFEMLHDRIVHVHTKDRGETDEAKAAGHRVNRGLAPVAVGNGYLPIKYIVQTLLSEGYKGYFSIEHFGSKVQLIDIISSAQYLLALEA